MATRTETRIVDGLLQFVHVEETIVCELTIEKLNGLILKPTHVGINKRFKYMLDEEYTSITGNPNIIVNETSSRVFDISRCHIDANANQEFGKYIHRKDRSATWIKIK